MPAVLLQVMQIGSQTHQDHPSSSKECDEQQQVLLDLLRTAEAFDPLLWATDLQLRSPAADLDHRKHVAAAHRGAVRIYLSRILLSLQTTSPRPNCLEDLVADIVSHLAFIGPRDALFTATTWPAFIAAAETSDSANQKWVKTRFQELWEIEPWGLKRGVLKMLEGIWEKRRRWEGPVDSEGSLPQGDTSDWNWIDDLRERGVDWLIM